MKTGGFFKAGKGRERGRPDMEWRKAVLDNLEVRPGFVHLSDPRGNPVALMLHGSVKGQVSGHTGRCSKRKPMFAAQA